MRLKKFVIILAIVNAACTAGRMLTQQGIAGLATESMMMKKGTIRNDFEARGPMREHNGVLYVEGIMFRSVGNGHLPTQRQGYTAISFDKNHQMTTSEIIFGDPPQEVLREPLIPTREFSGWGGGREEILADFLGSGQRWKLYDRHFLLVRNDNDPKTPYEYQLRLVTEEEKKPSIGYLIVYALAFLVDYVTAPFQIIFVLVVNSLYGNWT